MSGPIYRPHELLAARHDTPDPTGAIVDFEPLDPGTGPSGSGPSWTVKEAVDVFTRQGQPVDEWRLRMLIRAVSLQPAARAASGGEPGRPRAMYPAAALQRFHALITDYVSGDT